MSSGRQPGGPITGRRGPSPNTTTFSEVVRQEGGLINAAGIKTFDEQATSESSAVSTASSEGGWPACPAVLAGPAAVNVKIPDQRASWSASPAPQTLKVVGRDLPRRGRDSASPTRGRSASFPVPQRAAGDDGLARRPGLR